MSARAFAIVTALAALAGLAVAGLVWAKSYAPLGVRAYGPGHGIASGLSAEHGRLVFAVRYPTPVGELRFVVRNTGRWPITIDHATTEGLWPPSAAEQTGSGGHVQLVGLRRPGRPVAGGYALSTAPLRSVRVPAHGETELWVRVRGTCWGRRPSVTVSWSSIDLHYRYLGIFGRTQTVEWPFDLDYAC